MANKNPDPRLAGQCWKWFLHLLGIPRSCLGQWEIDGGCGQLSIQAGLDVRPHKNKKQESRNNFQTFPKCVKTKVFVMEVVVKLLLLSPRVYFTGTNYAWNIGATWNMDQHGLAYSTHLNLGPQWLNGGITCPPLLQLETSEWLIEHGEPCGWCRLLVGWCRLLVGGCLLLLLLPLLLLW